MTKKAYVRQLIADFRTRAAAEPFGVRGTLALAIDKLAHRQFRAHQTSEPVRHPEVLSIIEELRTRGFCAVESFVSSEKCQELVQRLQTAIQDNPKLIHPGTPYDLRLHGVENVDSEFAYLSEHPLLKEVACRYLEQTAKVAFTLGACLQSAKGNPGSGGGWHRDSFNRQFKTMLYLTDVEVENGPFQIIEGSHRFIPTIKDNIVMKQHYGISRMEHNQVMTMLEKTGKSRLNTLTAKAGTMLLFDSTTIHRGAPIQHGERMALTNYYYPLNEIGDSLYDHFKPVAGRLPIFSNV